MPNLSGIPAIDVAIGLAFLFFLLSIVCSSVNEALAAVLKLRARTLERGIRSMLDNKHSHTNNFYRDVRVQALIDPELGYVTRLVSWFGWLVKKTPSAFLRRAVSGFGRFLWWMRGPHRPSYIPSRVFALAVLDTFVPEGDAAPAAGAAPANPLPPHVAAALDRLPADSRLAQQARKALMGNELPATVRVILEDALSRSDGEIDEFRKSIERSFDEVMDRASGWYKRRIQVVLFIIGLVLAAVINADTFAIGQRLWRDDALRSAVAAQATTAISDTQAKSCGVTDPSNQPPGSVAAQCLNEVKQLKLPLGWDRAPIGTKGYLSKIIGILITAFALTLGAPFWFDLLGKVARLRGSGPAATEPAKPAG